MKNILFIFCTLVITLGLTNSSRACDACGCFTGLNAAGILPQFQKNFIGYRFLSTRFDHPQKESSLSHLGQVSRDEIYVQQIWARWYPHDRIPVFVNVPYKQHIRVAENGRESLTGIGDVSIKMFYQIIRPNDTLKRPLKHLLMIGGGIDLPTGRYQQRDASRKLYPMGFQLGNGAFVYDLRAIYTLRFKSVGINTEAYVLQPQENELEYRVGMGKGFSGSLFWWHQRAKSVWMPFIGVGLDRVYHDMEYGTADSGTGGNFQRWSAGVDFYWKGWVLGAALDKVNVINKPKTAPISGPTIRLTLLKNF